MISKYTIRLYGSEVHFSWYPEWAFSMDMKEADCSDNELALCSQILPFADTYCVNYTGEIEGM